MNHKQLTFAREYRGFTQSELAESINGLSQSNLSKFEKGFGTLSEDLVKKIIEFLNFPRGFFECRIEGTFDNANYRKKATINKSLRQRFENKCKLIGYVIDEFSDSLDWPEFTLIPLNVDEGYSPEHIARYTRNILRLPQGSPVENIVSLIEAAGVIIYEIDEDDRFDGVSFVTERNFPVIILNRNFPNDRKRFTIAHELGHLLMHNENHYPVSEHRDKEVEANIFAGEFLMPADSIRNSLRGLKLADLVSLKSYWLTSMSSIIRRARTLGCIDKDRYTYLSIEMSRSGYSKREPVEVFIDRPACFKNGIKLFEQELGYTIDDFVQFIRLPEDVISELFIKTDQVKLKAIRS